MLKEECFPEEQITCDFVYMYAYLYFVCLECPKDEFMQNCSHVCQLVITWRNFEYTDRVTDNFFTFLDAARLKT